MALNKQNYDLNKPVLILHNGSEIVNFNDNTVVTKNINQILPFVRQYLITST